MESIAWLETYLLNYSGAVIIVAHDRYFLDRVVTKIIELDSGHAIVYSRQLYCLQRKTGHDARDAQMKAYLNQQQEIKHQEEVIAKLKSFNREKSIKRAESREKMLDKIEVLDKPAEVKMTMDIRLEPNIVSGNDVLTVTDLSKSFGTPDLYLPTLTWTSSAASVWPSSAITVPAKTTLLKIINGIVPAGFR